MVFRVSYKDKYKYGLNSNVLHIQCFNTIYLFITSPDMSYISYISVSKHIIQKPFTKLDKYIELGNINEILKNIDISDEITKRLYFELIKSKYHEEN